MTHSRRLKSRLSAPELWERLQTVRLPDEGGLAFYQRLGQFLELGEDEARELELVYRRFLYLMARNVQRLDPPDRVLAAWHLHAQDSGYEAFCQRHLGRTMGYRAAAPGPDHDAALRALRIEHALEFGESMSEGMPPEPHHDSGDYHQIAQSAGLWLVFGVVGGMLSWVLPAQLMWIAVSLGMIGTIGFVIKISEVFSSQRARDRFLDDRRHDTWDMSDW